MDTQTKTLPSIQIEKHRPKTLSVDVKGSVMEIFRRINTDENFLWVQVLALNLPPKNWFPISKGHRDGKFSSIQILVLNLSLTSWLQISTGYIDERFLLVQVLALSLPPKNWLQLSKGYTDENYLYIQVWALNYYKKAPNSKGQHRQKHYRKKIGFQVYKAYTDRKHPLI